jgi:hypothetical protein
LRFLLYLGLGFSLDCAITTGYYVISFPRGFSATRCAPRPLLRPPALTTPKITPCPSTLPVVLPTLLHHAVCMRYPPLAPPCRCSMSRPAARCPGLRRLFCPPVLCARRISRLQDVPCGAPHVPCTCAPSAVAPTLRTLPRLVPVIPPAHALCQPRRISVLREVPWDAPHAPRTHSPPAAVTLPEQTPPHPRRASRTCAAPLGWPISVPYSNRFFWDAPQAPRTRLPAAAVAPTSPRRPLRTHACFIHT